MDDATELAETFGLVSLVMGRGVKIRAAEYLGVSPATITRDIRAIFRDANIVKLERLWKIERGLLTIKFKQAIKRTMLTDARQAGGNPRQKIIERLLRTVLTLVELLQRKNTSIKSYAR
jgi:hypothetical protein